MNAVMLAWLVVCGSTLTLAPLSHSFRIKTAGNLGTLELRDQMNLLDHSVGSGARWEQMLVDGRGQSISRSGLGLAVVPVRGRPTHCSFAYSALASFRMGMSGSASFHKKKKSW